MNLNIKFDSKKPFLTYIDYLNQLLENSCIKRCDELIQVMENNNLKTIEKTHETEIVKMQTNALNDSLNSIDEQSKSSERKISYFEQLLIKIEKNFTDLKEKIQSNIDEVKTNEVFNSQKVYILQELKNETEYIIMLVRKLNIINS